MRQMRKLEEWAYIVLNLHCYVFEKVKTVKWKSSLGESFPCGLWLIMIPRLSCDSTTSPRFVKMCRFCPTLRSESPEVQTCSWYPNRCPAQLWTWKPAGPLRSTECLWHCRHCLSHWCHWQLRTQRELAWSHTPTALHVCNKRLGHSHCLSEWHMKECYLLFKSLQNCPVIYS